MTSELQFTHVCGGQDQARLDVLFIHGLTGNPTETWKSGDDQEFWPLWLCEKFQDICIYTVGYPSSIFEKWAKKEMNLHERAENIIEYLASFGIGKRPIAMVTHSLGGLIAKEILRACNESGDDGWHCISDQTRLAVFMATPHKGAALAATVNLFLRVFPPIILELSAMRTAISLASTRLIETCRRQMTLPQSHTTKNTGHRTSL